ncbi:MAG: hypothetical protein Q9184_003898 [Pyrenodesmia sp. 2 TL-2023]
MGKIQVKQHAAYPIAVSDQSTEHVSAFAARKQAAPSSLSDVSDPLYPSAPRMSEEGLRSSDGTKKRKHNSAATVTKSKVQRIKRRKTGGPNEQQPRTRTEPSTGGVPPETSHQARQVASDRHAALYAETLNEANLADIPATTDRNGGIDRISQSPEHSLGSERSLIESEPNVSQDQAASSEAESESNFQNPDGSWVPADDRTVVIPADRLLSTFVPTDDNVIEQTSSAWTVSLKAGDTIVLVGQYDLWVRRGAVSVLGAVLYANPKTQRIFAPSTHSLPVIKPIRNPYGSGHQQTIITVSNCSSGLRMLRQVSPKFCRLWNMRSLASAGVIPPLDLSQRTFQYLEKSSIDPCKRPLRAHETPSDWQLLVSTLASQSHVVPPKAVLVCGPKGSGKSTFSRMLTNAILTKLPATTQAGNTSRELSIVALLDLDPGQPEFSPPGEVSLVQLQCCNFGPPFSHPIASTSGSRVIRSHHIGSISPKDDPQHYLRCVLDVFHHYKLMLLQHPSCPLVVNTAGWIQGSGLELLVDCIHCMDLTDVIYTSTQGPPEVLETISRATTTCKIPLHCLSSQPVEVPARSAADLRVMQTMSYFHLDEPERGDLRWNAEPISDMTPFSVHYAGPNQAIYGVLLLGQELDPDFLDQVIEGCIVGLVVVEDDTALPLQSGVQESDIHSNAERSDRDEELSEPDDHDTMSITSNPGPSSTPNYNHKPPLPRTSSSIPYIPTISTLTPPLPPASSYSLGQALIHSIDSHHHIINLHTPVPVSTLNAFHHQRKKLVLVRGKLETPTWALKEDLYMQMRRRRRIIREGLYEGEVDAWGKEDTRQWAEGRKYVTFGERKGRGKVRRVRRDLGRKRAD